MRSENKSQTYTLPDILRVRTNNYFGRALFARKRRSLEEQIMDNVAFSLWKRILKDQSMKHSLFRGTKICTTSKIGWFVFHEFLA